MTRAGSALRRDLTIGVALCGARLSAPEALPVGGVLLLLRHDFGVQHTSSQHLWSLFKCWQVIVQRQRQRRLITA